MSNNNVSEVSICNQALSWLGADRITSLDDPSKRAQLCKENYAYLRDAVLEERMWTFATVRAISEVQDRDEWDQFYVHPIPLGWQSVFRCYRRIYSDGSGDISTGWRVENNAVLAREEKVYLWGVECITDPGKFSPMFVQALAARIAADLAIPVTENRQLQADMTALYIDKLENAAARDGQQGGAEQIQTDRLTRVRRSRTLGGIY